MWSIIMTTKNFVKPKKSYSDLLEFEKDQEWLKSYTTEKGKQSRLSILAKYLDFVYLSILMHESE